MSTSEAKPPRRPGWGAMLGLLLLGVVLATAASVWIIRTYVFPSSFSPVELSDREEAALEAKLVRLEELEGRGSRSRGGSPPRVVTGDDAGLTPEPYEETNADRTIEFSERELNALVGENPDLARRVAIDLDENLISARVIVPVDEDFPVLGGHTLRLRAGVELRFAAGRPMVALKGVSIMGVPVPNAWLGGLKNIDLVSEFGTDPGFWKAFADGVDLIEVREGHVLVRLKE